MWGTIFYIYVEVYASKPLLRQNTKLVATLCGACLQMQGGRRTRNRAYLGHVTGELLSLWSLSLGLIEHTCLA
jgi:hypothetical protein